MLFLIFIVFLALSVVLALIFNNIELRKHNDELRQHNHHLFMQNHRLHWDVEFKEQELRMTKAEFGVKHLYKNRVHYVGNRLAKV